MPSRQNSVDELGRQASMGMKAVLVQTPYAKHSVHMYDHHAVGVPGEGEVLIQNVCCASNPKDWKIHDPKFMQLPSLIEGNDVAGTIAAVGDGVTRFKKGDRVGGFSRMATDSKYGAYAEFTVCPAVTTFNIADNVTFEQAATLPLASMTAAIGLYVCMKLPTPEDPAQTSRAIFINGGSSSVGHYAVQLAKLSNLYVITTAGSSANIAKDAGADVVIDYRNCSTEEIIARVKQAADGYQLEHSFDAVSENGSVEMCCSILPNESTSQIVVVLPAPEKLDAGLIQVSRVMVGTAYGEDSAFAEKYYQLIADWVGQGKFQCNRIKLMPDGLDSVATGLELLRTGKVSGENLVYRISDTPGIGVHNWH